MRQNQLGKSATPTYARFGARFTVCLREICPRKKERNYSSFLLFILAQRTISNPSGKMDDLTLIKEPGLKKKLPVIVKCPHKNKHILESRSSDFPNLFSFADQQEGVGIGDGSARAASFCGQAHRNRNVHPHSPTSFVAQFQTAHGLVVGCSLKVGDSCPSS